MVGDLVVCPWLFSGITYSTGSCKRTYVYRCSLFKWHSYTCIKLYSFQIQFRRIVVKETKFLSVVLSKQNILSATVISNSEPLDKVKQDSSLCFDSDSHVLTDVSHGISISGLFCSPLFEYFLCFCTAGCGSLAIEVLCKPLVAFASISIHVTSCQKHCPLNIFHQVQLFCIPICLF